MIDAKFITAISFYGAKGDALAGSLSEVQEVLRLRLGSDFSPYTLDQIHGTLVSFAPVVLLENGLVLNKHFHEVTGTVTPMDTGHAVSILQERLESPYLIRLGGHQPCENPPFLSRGEHPYDRMFSAQGHSLVLVGWPVATIQRGLAEAPLNDLRRAMNEAGITHLYHESKTDIDNDLHMVVGNYDNAAPEAVSLAVDEVRSHLAEHPVDFEMGINQVTIIAADSPTLAPPIFQGHIPADNVAIQRLFTARTGSGKSESAALRMGDE